MVTSFTKRFNELVWRYWTSGSADKCLEITNQDIEIFDTAAEQAARELFNVFEN